MNEKRYDRKNKNNNEIPTEISMGDDDLKMKKNGRKQNTAHA